MRAASFLQQQLVYLARHHQLEQQPCPTLGVLEEPSVSQDAVQSLRIHLGTRFLRELNLRPLWLPSDKPALRSHEEVASIIALSSIAHL